MSTDLRTNEQKQRYISALLEERRGHVTWGRTDQVEQVDAELARMGYQAETPHQRATKMERKPAEAHHGGRRKRADKDDDAKADDKKAEKADGGGE